MIVLELRFPAGRFHATPWGRHVNEGAVEWPPSPWRVLRAFIATWHLKAKAEVSEQKVRALVATLAENHPSYQLPKAGQGHTRHYLPFNEGKNEKTTKVFDTFIQITPSDAVRVGWNVVLPPEQLAVLQLLAHRLGYFGRAESLVEAHILPNGTEFTANAEPLADDAPLPPDKELVRLLAPLAPENYADWRRDFMAKAEATLGPKPTAAQKKKLPAVPAELFTALHADTGDLQSAGWNLPPGAMYVNYSRDERAFAPSTTIHRHTTRSRPTVARYAVVSAVSPRLTQAISVGNRVHDALCKWSDQAAVFTGRNAHGPLTGHEHAHIFCEANGPRDVITHITVWAPMGFDEARKECTALRRTNKVWGYGDHDIRLALLGVGEPGDFPDCPLFAKARVWRSATPFVSTRHPKTFNNGRPKIDEEGWQIGSAAHDLIRFLALDPRTASARIACAKTVRAGQRELRCLQFQTIRHGGGGSRGNGDTGAFTITFDGEVTGPLAFGYGAHFGLGLFIPAFGDPSE